MCSQWQCISGEHWKDKFFYKQDLCGEDKVQRGSSFINFGKLKPNLRSPVNKLKVTSFGTHQGVIPDGGIPVGGIPLGGVLNGGISVGRINKYY